MQQILCGRAAKLGLMSFAHFVGQFWTLTVWSIQSLFYIPPFTALFILAFLSLSLATWKQRPLQKPHWKRSHWLVLTQLLFFPAVISIGVCIPPPARAFIILNHWQAVFATLWACCPLHWLRFGLFE